MINAQISSNFFNNSKYPIYLSGTANTSVSIVSNVIRNNDKSIYMSDSQPARIEIDGNFGIVKIEKNDMYNVGLCSVNGITDNMFFQSNNIYADYTPSEDCTLDIIQLGIGTPDESDINQLIAKDNAIRLKTSSTTYKYTTNFITSYNPLKYSQITGNSAFTENTTYAPWSNWIKTSQTTTGTIIANNTNN